MMNAFSCLIIITISTLKLPRNPCARIPRHEGHQDKPRPLYSPVWIGTGLNFRAQFPWLRGILMAAMMPVPGS